MRRSAPTRTLMRIHTYIVLLLPALVLGLAGAGCSDDTTPLTIDSRSSDSSRPDGGPHDAGPGDGPGGLDGRTREAGAHDGTVSDTTVSDVGPTPNATSALGTNLGGIRDWSSEWTFVDAFKASRSWISGNTKTGAWDDKRSFDLDQDGWIKSLKTDQIARTLLFWGLDDLYPAGRYVVLYAGKGTLEYWSSAKKNAGASTPGRDVIDVDPKKGGLGINISAIDSKDPLRDIRVLMPGGACGSDTTKYCEKDADCGAGAGSCVLFEKSYQTQIFHPTFLSRLKRYNLLRMMDWMQTNGSTQKTWSERPKISDARWSEKGVPAEIMLALANRLHADLWLTVPHLADDNYVMQLAKAVHAGLDPALLLYIEHSNEVWNGQFAQAGYAQAQGLALKLSTNKFQAQLYYHAKRSVEIFKLTRAAFGADAARVVRVLGSQAASSWVSEQVLGFQNAAKETDALAIAPYIGGYLGGPSQQAVVSKMSLSALFTELDTVALPKSVGWIKDSKKIADTNAVTLIAYEGGQHLTGNGGVENNVAINKLFDNANRDPRMGALYEKYLTAWKKAGGQLFAHFNNCGGYSKWGRWGALEHLRQARSKAPKYDALMTFIETTPAWW